MIVQPQPGGKYPEMDFSGFPQGQRTHLEKAKQSFRVFLTSRHWIRNPQTDNNRHLSGAVIKVLGRCGLGWVGLERGPCNTGETRCC
jgi:hypothetical protein